MTADAPAPGIAIRGRATAEEVAVVLALVQRPAEVRESAYATWRRIRRAAVRRTTS